MLTLWQVFSCVFGAGFIGGLLNAFMSDNRFVVPKSIANESGGTVLQPGILGNALIGAIAASVSWGIYGAQSSAPVGGPETYALPMSVLAGAALMGVGGGRWLSAQVDKTLRALEQHVFKRKLLRRFVITRFDTRRRMSHEIYQEIGARFTGELCQTRISENVSVAESPAANEDVFTHSPGSRGAQDYEALLDELIEAGFVG